MLAYVIKGFYGVVRLANHDYRFRPHIFNLIGIGFFDFGFAPQQQP